MYPLGRNSTIVPSNYVNNNTYITGNGKSITYLVNGQAGNIESHSNFAANGDHRLNITAYLVRVPPPPPSSHCAIPTLMDGTGYDALRFLEA